MTPQTAAQAEEILRDIITQNPRIVLDAPEVMRALLTAHDETLGQNIVDLRSVAMARLEAQLGRHEETTPQGGGPVLRFIQAWGAICEERGLTWNEAALVAKHHTESTYLRKDGSEGRFGSLHGPELLKEVVPGFNSATWSALP